MVYIDIVYIVLGIILLMLGRKLFWLFAGGVAFIFGLKYASLFLGSYYSSHSGLIFALVLAIVGIVLAFIMQKIGLTIAGCVAGGYVALNIVKELGIKTGWMPWILFLIGAVLGVIFVSVLFNWSLIILSSLIGTFLIIETTSFSLPVTKVLFILLLIIGILTQASQSNKKRKE